MTVKDLYSELIFKRIDKFKADKMNQLFVILRQTTLVELDNKNNFIADRETFNLEKDDQVFNKKWFSKIFTVLNQNKEYHLLSFAQFSYLIYYIDPSFFNDRVVIIKDNLRQLFPIDKHDYLEMDEKENIELRPDKLPIYQAEQIAVNERYYYSIKTPINTFNSVSSNFLHLIIYYHERIK